MSGATGLNALTVPLLALVALNVLPGLVLRPLWSMVAAAVLLGARYWLHYSQMRMPPRWTVWLAQIAIGLGVWQQYQSIFGDEAAGTLLMLLTCLKTFELRKKRDYFVTALLCVLVLMSFLLLDQSLTLTAFLLADVVLLFSFLFALEDERWSWTAWKPALKPSLMLALKAMPLLVLLFVLFPRFETGFGTGANTNSKTGITDSLRPGSVSRLTGSDDLVFRATFLDGVTPLRNQLYWRGAVLDRSNGLNWDRLNTDERVRIQPSLRGDNGDIEIYLEPGYEKFLFALDDTATMNFPNDPRGVRVGQREGRIYELEQPLQRRERYYLQRSTEVPREQIENLNRYLQVEEKPSRAMETFLASYRGLPANEVVSKLTQNFRSGGYTYSMSPPKSESLDEFMFKNKVGFCEHYSASTATILRYLGIPARVVTGFQGGTPTLLENYITVRAHDAHAWVEYYDAQSGRWRRVDPTAQVAPTRITMGSESYLPDDLKWLPEWVPGDWRKFLRRARTGFDEIEATWIGFLLRFDLARQKELLSRLGMEEVLFRALPVFLILSLAFVLAVLYFFEAQRREPLSENERLYRQLLSILERHRVRKEVSEGPVALLDKVRRVSPQLAAEVEPVLETLILARYGANPLADARLDDVRWKLKALRKLSIKAQAR